MTLWECFREWRDFSIDYLQWNVTDGSEEAKVHQQKLRVVYMPAEGEVLEEEDEPPTVNQTSFLSSGDPVSALRDH